MQTIRKLIKNSKAATAIEYGLIAALIAVAAIAAMQGLGTSIRVGVERLSRSLMTGNRRAADQGSAALLLCPPRGFRRTRRIKCFSRPRAYGRGWPNPLAKDGRPGSVDLPESLVEPRRPVMQRILKLIRNSKGATAIEYGLIAALIAVAAITAMQGLGTSIRTTFNNAASAMNG